MIDISYFAWRDTRVSNILDKCDDRNSYFQLFMKRLEREVLLKTLGLCLYEDYKSQLDIDGNILLTADQKWDKLLFGETYETSDSECSCSCKDCKKHIWKGIYNLEHKRSYVAHYISYMWDLENESQIFSTGQQIAKVKNSDTVSNERSRVFNWNEFVAWVQLGYSCGEVGLYHYLKDKEEDFPEWSGECFQILNVWNI